MIKQIENIDQAKAFAMFLASERNRHINDVRRAEADLLALAETWSIPIPWDNEHFIVVRGHKKTAPGNERGENNGSR